MFSQPSVEDDRDHRLEQQGVRAGADGQMDIGNLRGFRKPGIDDDQQFVRIFRDTLKLPRCLGDLMALHPIPSQIRAGHPCCSRPAHREGIGVHTCARHPEGTGEFLCQRAILILRT